MLTTFITSVVYCARILTNCRQLSNVTVQDNKSAGAKEYDMVSQGVVIEGVVIELEMYILFPSHDVRNKTVSV